MIDLVLDMETADPDDCLALIWLLGRPDVRLKAITLMPGSAHQVGLVREILRRFERDVPLGASLLNHRSTCVSPWHYRLFGECAPSFEAEPADELLLAVARADVTLLTAAPLKNIGAAMRRDADGAEGRFRFGRWVAQGGFAGEGVVSPDHQLGKFKGLSHCPSYNFDGARKTAARALSIPFALERRLVGKNVCHGVVFDPPSLSRLRDREATTLSTELLVAGMEIYLRNHPGGKKLHDPVAACCAVDPTIGSWAEVEVTRTEAGWGASLAEDSGTWALVDLDRERFWQMLVQ